MADSSVYLAIFLRQYVLSSSAAISLLKKCIPVISDMQAHAILQNDGCWSQKDAWSFFLCPFYYCKKKRKNIFFQMINFKSV